MDGRADVLRLDAGPYKVDWRKEDETDPKDCAIFLRVLKYLQKVIVRGR
jgi:hypothetical protein